MKQKRLVSMIGVLAVIVSAVVLITGCSQPNSNKINSSDNGNSNNLNGTAWFESGYHIGYYFLGVSMASSLLKKCANGYAYI